MQKLSNISSIFSGYSFRETLNPNGQGFLKVIQAKNLEGFGKVTGATPILPFPKYEKYLLKNQDILLISKGANNSVSLLEMGEEEDLVATASFVIIRINQQKADPAYIAWFLQLAETQAKLKAYQQTSTVPNLSIKAVQEFLVPMISLNKQREIGELFRLEYRRQYILKELEQKKSLLLNHKLTKLLSDGI